MSFFVALELIVSRSRQQNKNAITNLYLSFLRLARPWSQLIFICVTCAYVFFQFIRILVTKIPSFSNSIERSIFLTISLRNISLDRNYTRSGSAAFTDSLNEKNFCRLDKYRETHVGRGNMFTYVKHRFPAESGVRAYTQCLRRKQFFNVHEGPRFTTCGGVWVASAQVSMYIVYCIYSGENINRESP